MIHDLSTTDSLISHYISEIRDKDIQQDRMRFRKNLERIASLLAFEMSKSLDWVDVEISTPLGFARGRQLKAHPVVCSILRAGLAMHQGVLEAFDQADSAFISAYRKHDEGGGFHIQLGYLTCPDLTGRTLIMVDPMLATGQSLVACANEVLKAGKPSEIHILTAIAATEGVAFVFKHFPEAQIWAAAIDHSLDDKAYIVPGLGDAGDLAFGLKLQA